MIFLNKWNNNIIFFRQIAALKELQRDSEEAHLSKSEAIQQYKELEKKVKTVESDLIQMQEVIYIKLISRIFFRIFFFK